MLGGKQQITDFWDDVCSGYKRKSEDYFLGLMVFAQDTPAKIKILDGQQRLATILLLSAALRDVLKDSVFEKSPKWVDEINRILYTRNMVNLAENPKLELNKEDRIFFEKLVIQGVISDTKYTSHKFIKGAYEFFRDNIKTYITQEGEKFVEGILNVIMNKLVIIEILCTQR